MNWVRDLTNPQLEKKIFSNSLLNIYSVRQSSPRENQTKKRDSPAKSLIPIRFLLEIPQFFSKTKQYPLFLSKEIKPDEIFYFPLALAVEKKSLHFLFELYLSSASDFLDDFLFSIVEMQESLKKTSPENQILRKNAGNKQPLLKMIVPSTEQIIYFPLNMNGAIFYWTSLQQIKKFHDLETLLKYPHWSFPFFHPICGDFTTAKLCKSLYPTIYPSIYPWQFDFVIYQNKNHLFILSILNDIFSFKAANREKLDLQKKMSFGKKELDKEATQVDKKKSQLHFSFYLSIIYYLSYSSKPNPSVTIQLIFSKILQKMTAALFLSLSSYLQVSQVEKLIKKMNELFRMFNEPYLLVCYNILYGEPTKLPEYQKLSLLQKIKSQLFYLKWNMANPLTKKQQLKNKAKTEKFIKLINMLIDKRTREKKENHLFLPFSCQLFWQKRKLGQLLKTKILFLPTVDELLELQSLANKLFKTKK